MYTNTIYRGVVIGGHQEELLKTKDFFNLLGYYTHLNLSHAQKMFQYPLFYISMEADMGQGGIVLTRPARTRVGYNIAQLGAVT